MSDANETRDWPGLAPDLLNLIADNLTDISDHRTFRSVCSTFRATISTPPPTLPWLFTKRNTTCLHTLHNNKLFTHHSPSSSSSFITNKYHRVYGSSFGYLIIYNSYESITLFNPFTGSHIPLPPLPSYSYTKSVYRGKLIESPDTPLGFCVVFTYQRFCRFGPIEPPCLYLFILGESEWGLIDPPAMDDFGGWSDFTFHDERFFLMRGIYANDELDGLDDSDPRVTECDVVDETDPEYTMTIPSAGIGYACDKTYVVESSSGELLMLVRSTEVVERFEVFQLGRTRRPRWYKVTNIGNDVLFVDKYNAICLSWIDAGGCKGAGGCNGNCIVYFCDDKSGIGVFDIADGTVRKLCGGDMFPQGLKGAAWIVPGL